MTESQTGQIWPRRGASIGGPMTMHFFHFISNTQLANNCVLNIVDFMEAILVSKANKIAKFCVNFM